MEFTGGFLAKLGRSSWENLKYYLNLHSFQVVITLEVPNSGESFLGDDVAVILSDKVKGSGDWNSSEYQDTAGSKGKKVMNALSFYKIEIDEVSERYIAPCFVNGLEAYDGEIHLAYDENLISNEELYFVTFIINPKEDDVEPRIIVGRSFMRIAKGIVDFGNWVITVYPEQNPFKGDFEKTGKSPDDWDELLDFNFNDIPKFGEEQPLLVYKMELDGKIMKEEKEAIKKDEAERRKLDTKMGIQMLLVVIARWMKRKGADLDTTTLKEFIDFEGSLIPEVPHMGAPRVGMPRPLRASMQDLYDRIGSMKIRHEVIERWSIDILISGTAMLEYLSTWPGFIMFHYEEPITHLDMLNCSMISIISSTYPSHHSISNMMMRNSVKMTQENGRERSKMEMM
nr:hypothetical protein [Tanacetum cinerariifolium]